MPNERDQTPSSRSSTALAAKRKPSSPPVPKDAASRLLPTLAKAEPDFAAFLVLQANATALPFTDSHRDLNDRFIQAALRSIGPRDALEALLAVQMVRTHNLALAYLERAGGKGQTVLGIQIFSNFANRLLQTFTAQMETLKTYRTKGEQKVEVKHVHVNRGGQAIVGAVSHGGGGDADQK
jgi:hypothetical protein